MVMMCYFIGSTTSITTTPVVPNNDTITTNSTATLVDDNPRSARSSTSIDVESEEPKQDKPLPPSQPQVGSSLQKYTIVQWNLDTG